MPSYIRNYLMRRQSEKYMITPIKTLNFTTKIKIVLKTYLFINLRDMKYFSDGTDTERIR